jgi:hypothetical protein
VVIREFRDWWTAEAKANTFPHLVVLEDELSKKSITAATRGVSEAILTLA